MHSGEFWESDNGYSIKYDGRAQPRDFSERNKARQRRLEEAEFDLGETVSVRRTRRPPMPKIHPGPVYIFLERKPDGGIGFTKGFCDADRKTHYLYGKGLQTMEIAKDLLYPRSSNISKDAQEILWSRRISDAYNKSMGQLGGTSEA